MDGRHGRRRPESRLPFSRISCTHVKRCAYCKTYPHPSPMQLIVGQMKASRSKHYAQIICTFLATDSTCLSIQLSLLKAALTAGVKRFAPPEFGCGPLAFLSITMLKSQVEVWDACKEAQKAHPGIECAGFEVGLFMNYLGKGCSNEKEALAGKHDDAEFIFYMHDMRALIPLKTNG